MACAWYVVVNNNQPAALQAVWRDPDFDPAEEAFYHAHLLENLTLRWTTCDAARFGVAMPRDGLPSGRVPDR
jgi:hypothetical protein